MRPVPTPRTQPISRGIWAVITTLLMSVPAIAGANPITAYQSGEKLTYDVKGWVRSEPGLQVGKARKVRGKKDAHYRRSEKRECVPQCLSGR